MSISQLTRPDISTLFALADRMAVYTRREKRSRVLDGAILGNMFFEPSTRTRISFGCAFNLLGGQVRETAGFGQSALTKGESLYDTARVLSGYSDVIVMRHPQAGSVEEFARASRVPVINGGDGDNEHPSQALLDLYTIDKELQARGGGLDHFRIALIGDLRHGRTVHSICQLLALYKGVELVLISPRALRMPAEMVELLRDSGHTVIESDHLEDIRRTDIAYATRIQEERFSDPREAAMYRGRYRLDRAVYTRYCESNTVIMHPLPRYSLDQSGELSDDLNTHPNLAIFRQTDNGVLVRMALFALIFDVAGQLERHEQPLSWRSLRRF